MSVLPLSSTGAQSDAELREQQKELEQERAELEAQRAEEQRVRDEAQAELLAKIAEVDLQQADVDEVLSALDISMLLANEQHEDYAKAQLAVDLATEAEDAALYRLNSLVARRAELQQRGVDLVVQTYIGHDALVEGSYGLARTGDIYDAARIRVLIGAALGDVHATADEVRALSVDMELAARELQYATEQTERLAAESGNALQERLDVAKQDQQVVDELESRLDRLLIEQGIMEENNDAAADQVAQTTKRIEASLAKHAELQAELKRREDARLRAARAEAERRRREREGTAGQPTGTNFNRSELTWVGGIQVHESIASQVEDLLEHAARDGIRLTGGGYRSAASQIALRRAHCGTSEWAIWQKPSWQCRPPTARPGRSMHERGLAIDFRHNGRSITSRNSVAFRWLAANARTYGLKNLPSEPWHWSTDGS
ncbi:D-alanyl-D-alanine carboxypeptidase family protein [Candidatus Poriferisodalis sp.]|uniref:D-alanyl-D-alanine carboxypeptidase family protein n=1 Tax=Candidatus Poriferisodalis sp. TaxID=3101277 RepID=UPI003B018F83